MSDRKLGYKGTTLDIYLLTDAVREILAAQFGGTVADFGDVNAEETILLERVGEYGTPEYSTLITEGVRGERVPSTNTIEVYVMSGFQSAVVPVGVPRLLAARVTKGDDELVQVEVAEFVRVFGGRLDSNVYRAQAWMDEFKK